MKVKGKIWLGAMGSFYFELTTKDWYLRPFCSYSSHSSARRAANRVAKKLGLEIEWEK